jgi:Interleukin-like EMT inducer
LNRRSFLLLFALLAAAHTWPLVAQAATHTLDDGDSLLNAWLLAAVSRAVVSHPLTFFDINSYYPYRHALGTLDHQLSAVLFAGPLYLASGNPQLALNLYTLATFVFGGVFTAMLVAELTGSGSAGLIAGSLFAFSSERLENINHSHILGNFWLPLSLLLMHRYAAAPSWRRLWALVGVALLLALTAWYNAAIGPVAIGIAAVAELVRRRATMGPAIARLAVGGLAASLLVGAIAVSYARIAHDFRSPPHHAWEAAGSPAPDSGSERVVAASVIQDNSTGLPGFIGARTDASAPWLRPLRGLGLVGGRSFPGFVGAALALVALAIMGRAQMHASRLAWPSVVMAAIFIAAVFSVTTHRLLGWPLVLSRTSWFFPCMILSFAAWILLPMPADPAHPWIDKARTYFVIALVGGALSLGLSVYISGVRVAQGIYPAGVPGFNVLRAPVRFMTLCALGTAVLAGCGYATISRGLRGRARIVSAVIAILLVNVELFAPLARMRRVPRVPRVYEWLRDAPPGPVVEFPVHANLWSLYWSLVHRQPLVQGYGLVEPPAYSRLTDGDDVSPAMVEHIRSYFHARYIAIDRTKYADGREPALAANIALNGATLNRVAAFDGREVYEIAGPSRGAPVLRAYRPWMVDRARGVAVEAEIETLRSGAPHAVQVWGNGRLLSSVPWARGAARQRIFATLPVDRGDGVNIEVLGDYLATPPDIAVDAQMRATRLQIDGHVWVGRMGYTLAVVAPDGRVDEVRNFNTSWDAAASHALAARIAAIPEGWTAAVATNYDASRALTADAVAAFRTLGMQADLRGRFRVMHAGIGTKGAAPGTALEQVSSEGSHVAIGTPALVPVVVRDVRIY